MKIMKLLATLAEYLVFIALLAILVVVASPLLPTKTILATYVVSSGSMEPAIHTGSIILSRPTDISTLAVNDIITFTSPEDPKKVIVHRIIEIQNSTGSKMFITKGDHNDTKDNWLVSPSLIKGKSVGQIPLVGFVIEYLKTVKGFIIGIGIPTLILIALEIKKIKEGIEEEVRKRTQKEIARIKIEEITTIMIMITISLVFTKPVQAYFSAQTSLTNITLKVANNASVKPGDVVINEIMWAGSSVSTDDLWLELLNTTDHEINISQWIIENAAQQSGSNSSNIHLRGNATIAANGFYVITKRNGNSANSALAKKGDEEAGNINFHYLCGNEPIRLTTKESLVIDEVKTFPWPAGSFSPHRSMERNDASTSGMQSDNWHSCLDGRCASTDYWRITGENFGTPGAPNSPAYEPPPPPPFHHPSLHLFWKHKHHQAHFELKGIDRNVYTAITYTFSYIVEGVPQIVTSTINLDQETTEIAQDIDLGTCSDKTCIQPEETTQVQMEVTLQGNPVNQTLAETIPD